MTPQSAASFLLFMPLLAAFCILVLGRTLGTFVSKTISVGSAVICFIVSLLALFSFQGGKPVIDGTGALLQFLSVPGLEDAHLGFFFNAQSRGMLFIVTFIGLLVHVYSLGYMHEDKAQSRYFGSLSMFMFSMTGIVLADNFAMMFVFWELVGLSSYLLIGHWFEKPTACDAAKKAFLTNRIGDFGFMIGILAIWSASNGELSFAGLKESLGNATASGPLATAPAWVWTLAALGIFMGAVGKSAQAPLHVWLPDAMEGPTPVSALIHAATMVAAGVYMLMRVSFLIEHSETAMQIIAGVGGVTALMAALMALQQNDIKRILAYSTLSQLGYMVMAVGLKAGEAGMYHLYTHAFFKALLFLGSGAVIYACHHEQDIWKMGGLSKKTPATFLTFLIGTLALTGFPGLSGFWSKETILAAAADEHHGCMILFWVAAITALLTPFYMTRAVVVTFLGKARSENADHAHEAPMIMLAPLLLLSIFAIGSGYSLFTNAFQAMTPESEHAPGWVMGVSIAAFVIGSGLAFVLYNGKDKDPINVPILANRFKIDELYAWIVKTFQDRVAWIISALDHIFVDGLVARLPAFIACRIGKAGRAVQSGQLQGYTFALGAGLLLIIYFIVQMLPTGR